QQALAETQASLHALRIHGQIDPVETPGRPVLAGELEGGRQAVGEAFIHGLQPDQAVEYFPRLPDPAGLQELRRLEEGGLEVDVADAEDLGKGHPLALQFEDLLALE